MILSTQNIQKTYHNTGRHFSFPNLSCNQGQTLLITGQSGCGKTTLLHILGGLLKADSGVINIGDADISKISGSHLNAIRGSKIGFIFQNPKFVQSLTIAENLAVPVWSATTHKNKIQSLAETLQIAHCLRSKPEYLSNGELQRAGIARALMCDPILILADEPTSALDDNNCFQAFNLLQENSLRLGAALVIVTHDNRLTSRVDHQILLT